MKYIEKTVDLLKKKGIKNISGMLITNYYLDGVVEEINASLKISGIKITFDELFHELLFCLFASRHSSVNFARSTVFS